MTKSDLIVWWACAFFSALTVVAGRLGYMLFGMAPTPPDDPVQLRHWVRKRKWLAASELSALPAFATIAVAAQVYLNLPPVVTVMISMALGGLGFGFLLNGLQRLARRKLKSIEESEESV